MIFLHLSFKNLSCTFCAIFGVFRLCLPCNFVDFRGWHVCKSLFVYIFQFGSVFSSLTSSETSLSIAVLFVLLRTGWSISIVKLRVRFRFPGKIRRLGKKQKPRENSDRHFTNGLMA